jgi:hypothetical protein
MNNTINLPANKWLRSVKKLIGLSFIISLILLSLDVLANPPLATKQQIGMFMNSKTYVVIENDNISYSANIKDAVQKFWKITSYEFIDGPEFEKRRFDSKYSFLVLTKGVFAKDPSGVSYSYIRLVLGSTASEITNMPEFCSIPLSYTDDNNADFDYAIPSIVKFMQMHIKTLEKKRFLLKLNGLSFYNSTKSFNAKVLLLNKDKMAENANSPEKILTVYPYYVKLLSSTEILKELSPSPPNTMFEFHVGPPKNTGAGQSFDMIFDVEGNLYYYAERKVTNENGDGFNLNNFYSIK